MTFKFKHPSLGDVTVFYTDIVTVYPAKHQTEVAEMLVSSLGQTGLYHENWEKEAEFLAKVLDAKILERDTPPDTFDPQRIY